MGDPYIGEIRCFGFNFAPLDWAFCNGQLQSIAQNTALFSILGTTYGGDGVTTFGLPNLQGRSPMHWGTGSMGLNTTIGEMMGETQVTLTNGQMPQHTHPIYAASDETPGERSAGPNTNGASYISQSAGGFIYQPTPSTPNTAFSPNAISPAGSSFPHNNMQPYLALNFCISLYGVFPQRG